ncbi:MAG: hypothetical protein EOO75_16360, partial [Myxococcales bacterium]
MGAVATAAKPDEVRWVPRSAIGDSPYYEDKDCGKAILVESTRWSVETARPEVELYRPRPDDVFIDLSEGGWIDVYKFEDGECQSVLLSSFNKIVRAERVPDAQLARGTIAWQAVGEIEEGHVRMDDGFDDGGRWGTRLAATGARCFVHGVAGDGEARHCVSLPPRVQLASESADFAIFSDPGCQKRATHLFFQEEVQDTLPVGTLVAVSSTESTNPQVHWAQSLPFVASVTGVTTAYREDSDGCHEMFLLQAVDLGPAPPLPVPLPLTSLPDTGALQRLRRTSQGVGGVVENLLDRATGLRCTLLDFDAIVRCIPGEVSDLSGLLYYEDAGCQSPVVARRSWEMEPGRHFLHGALVVYPATRELLRHGETVAAPTKVHERDDAGDCHETSPPKADVGYVWSRATRVDPGTLAGLKAT